MATIYIMFILSVVEIKCVVFRVCVCVRVGWLPQCVWIHGVYLQRSREVLDLHTGAMSGQGDLNMLLSLSLSLSLLSLFPSPFVQLGR